MEMSFEGKRGVSPQQNESVIQTQQIAQASMEMLFEGI